MNKSINIFLLSIAACTSCAAPPSDPKAKPSRSDPTIMERRKEIFARKRVAPIPAAPAAAIGEVPSEVMEKVRQDLAKRLGHNRMILQRAESVTWSDGAMGCPQPGIAYPQLIIEGYHVVYEADGKPWDYRLNGEGQFVLCTKEHAPFF